MKYCVSLFLVSLILLACQNTGLDEYNKKGPEGSDTSLVIVKDTINYHTRHKLYDSLQAKFGDHKVRTRALLQMKYEVARTGEYLRTLRKKFILACGDSSGTTIPPENENIVVITDRFFRTTGDDSPFHSDPAPGYLWSYILQSRSSLYHNTHNDSLLEAIRQFAPLRGRNRSSYTNEHWRDGYFKGVPPIMAITILDSFVSRLQDIELAILQDHLKQ